MMDKQTVFGNLQLQRKLSALASSYMQLNIKRDYLATTGGVLDHISLLTIWDWPKELCAFCAVQPEPVHDRGEVGLTIQSAISGLLWHTDLKPASDCPWRSGNVEILLEQEPVLTGCDIEFFESGDNTPFYKAI